MAQRIVIQGQGPGDPFAAERDPRTFTPAPGVSLFRPLDLPGRQRHRPPGMHRTLSLLKNVRCTASQLPVELRRVAGSL